VVDRDGLPAAGAGGGGGALVRKRVRGPACSFGMRRRRWWEGWFGQCGGGVVRPSASDCSPELVLERRAQGPLVGIL
jgi:hypothetical protein